MTELLNSEILFSQKAVQGKNGGTFINESYKLHPFTNVKYPNLINKVYVIYHIA